jgi:hypothetical protein
MFIYKKYKTLFAFFLICIMLYSCGAPRTIRKNFTFKYDGQNTEIEKLIKVNGYYTIAETHYDRVYSKEYSDKYTTVRDTFYMNYLFFKDGIFLWNMFVSDCNRPNCMSESLKKTAKDTTGDRKLYLIGTWGRYIICGDTIKTQIVHHRGSLNDMWSASEIDYKVLNNNTIIQIDEKPLHYMTQSDWANWYQIKKERKYKPATFVQVEVVPNSDCWLKKEKWFWKNDSIITKRIINGG